GRWTKAEESHLLEIVRALAQEGQTPRTRHGFWIEVSKRMDNARGPKQCQNKWSDSLEPKTRSQNKSHDWTHNNTVVLVHKVACLGMGNEHDVDWKGLAANTSWSRWSAHALQQKWRKLK
ncbi:hypothetical protein BC834DRAFT_798650, partial [Gloeopeniophorella convolvens]